MEKKNIIASLYLRNGVAVSGFQSLNSIGNMIDLAKVYNDNGVDKLLVFDLSQTDKEQEANLLAIKELIQSVEIPVCAGGNIKQLEDIKKLLYAGCTQVFLNGRKSGTTGLAKEGAARFGKEKITITLNNVDILFKHKKSIEENVCELFVLNEEIIDTMKSVTEMPYSVFLSHYNPDRWGGILRSEDVLGVFSPYIDDVNSDIMALKSELSAKGIPVKKLASAIEFRNFKLNADGLIPVVVQDYQSCEVLMMAYMNREAFETTVSTGKMTYYSRSRQALWVKGETSGHFQYAKSLMLDCDGDTVLAKVAQVGVACHTGEPSCFFQELVKKEYVEKNPMKVFDNLYAVIAGRKADPKPGSYTNYLFEKGIDKILKKVGEEATEIVIAAKNPEVEEIKYEVADFLYHLMVLMVEKGVTWEDITRELVQR